MCSFLKHHFGNIVTQIRNNIVLRSSCVSASEGARYGENGGGGGVGWRDDNVSFQAQILKEKYKVLWLKR